MASTALLVRTQFKPQPIPQVSELLDKASEMLGYKPKVLSKRDEDIKNVRGELAMAEALKKLEIEPLKLPGVLAYKNEMVANAVDKGASAITRYMHGESGETWVKSLSVAGVIIGVLDVVISTVVFCDPHGPKFSLFNAFSALSPMVLLWGIVAILGYLRHKKAYSIQAGWDITAIGNYPSAIPEFALQRMIEVKQELPDVTFSIESFYTEKKRLKTYHNPPKVYLDPFLIATYEGSSVYLDVWDEPKFEGRRLV